MPPPLEVIACSLDDALAAEGGGAARLELVSALARGGLTPSLAVLDTILARVRIPVRVMVRETVEHVVADGPPRGALLAAAGALASRPIDGIVFGALAGPSVDERLLAAVAAAARCRVTFHRAFESVSNPETGVSTLQRHAQVDRILYNGGGGDWPERAARVGRLAALAAPAIRIIVGGGVTEDALGALTGIPAPIDIHVGRLARQPPTDMGRVSEARVAALVQRLQETFG